MEVWSAYPNNVEIIIGDEQMDEYMDEDRWMDRLGQIDGQID